MDTLSSKILIFGGILGVLVGVLVGFVPNLFNAEREGMLKLLCLLVPVALNALMVWFVLKRTPSDEPKFFLAGLLSLGLLAYVPVILVSATMSGGMPSGTRYWAIVSPFPAALVILTGIVVGIITGPARKEKLGGTVVGAVLGLPMWSALLRVFGA